MVLGFQRPFWRCCLEVYPGFGLEGSGVEVWVLGFRGWEFCRSGAVRFGVSACRVEGWEGGTVSPSRLQRKPGHAHGSFGFWMAYVKKHKFILAQP